MKISSCIVLLVVVAASSTVAAADVGDRSITTLRGHRRLKHKKDTEAQQGGRNVDGKKKKGKKNTKKGSKDAGKAMAAVSGAFQAFTTQMQIYQGMQGMNVLGSGPLRLDPSREEGKQQQQQQQPETPPNPLTPPSNVKQEEGVSTGAGKAPSSPPDDTPDKGTDGAMPEVDIPEEETGGAMMPEDDITEKETDGTMMPEVDEPGDEADGAMMPEDDMPENAGGAMPADGADDTSMVTPPPEDAEKEPKDVPGQTSPPQQTLETSPPAKTTPTTTTGGNTGGNNAVARPNPPLGDCTLNIASLVAKEDPMTTTKKCSSSCECADRCCVPWVFGSFCAAKHPTRAGKAAFGGGYVGCMPDPSQ